MFFITLEFFSKYHSRIFQELRTFYDSGRVNNSVSRAYKTVLLILKISLKARKNKENTFNKRITIQDIEYIDFKIFSKNFFYILLVYGLMCYIQHC